MLYNILKAHKTEEKIIRLFHLILVCCIYILDSSLLGSPFSSVGRAQDSYHCGRGFGPHDGRGKFFILSMDLLNIKFSFRNRSSNIIIVGV